MGAGVINFLVQKKIVPEELLYYIYSFVKRTKLRKYQKGTKGGIKSNITKLEFGKYGLKALHEGRISARTIEAVRQVMTRT